jgi:hypothetical protein
MSYDFRHAGGGQDFREAWHDSWMFYKVANFVHNYTSTRYGLSIAKVLSARLRCGLSSSDK